MPQTVNWYYHRKNCNSCKKMEAFLEKEAANVKEVVIANKIRFDDAKALELAHAANIVHIAKGKKLYSFDMKKEAPADEELLKHMLGPHGNLRAPVVVKGKALFVGFHEEGLQEHF
ncbi:transcriptional regulator Spx [Polystyrenella longa]|uniref:Transcriptional regulator Spx n=1 Tax=Polystyrenella longa TaxID=2528007 RepID=A0A518CIF5_9PLAN|nr:ArsC family (seleno)protein [Polystyrenella longa]QDU79009.1 transcriptional regulator Spx [Polystyrenella longa]